MQPEGGFPLAGVYISVDAAREDCCISGFPDKATLAGQRFRQLSPGQARCEDWLPHEPSAIHIGTELHNAKDFEQSTKHKHLFLYIFPLEVRYLMISRWKEKL